MSLFIKFLCCCFIILTSSCKKRSSIPSKKSNMFEFVDLSNSKYKIDEPKILDFQFDDSLIFKNKFVTGKLVYDMSLDTLSLDDISNRYIVFLATTKKDSLETPESIAKGAQYKHGDSINSGIFKFRVKFSSVIDPVLTIAIVDFKFLRENEGDEEQQLIKKSLIISLPVFVIDSTSVLGYKGDTVYFTKDEKTTLKRKDSLGIAKEQQRKIDSMKKVLNN